MAKKVQKELDRQTALLERKDIISKSLETNGAIIIAKDIEEAIMIADEVAPEHLEVCTENAGEVAMKLSNAGAIFVGNFLPNRWEIILQDLRTSCLQAEARAIRRCFRLILL